MNFVFDASAEICHWTQNAKPQLGRVAHTM